MNFIEVSIFLFIFFIVYLYLLTNIGNILIKKVLALRSNPDDNLESVSKKGNGSLIGNLERILFFIGVVLQNWTLIGIIVALKTIGRYNKLDNQEFAEYFLIGSFLSLLYSILLGLIFIFIISYIDDLNFLKDIIDPVYKVKVV